MRRYRIKPRGLEWVLQTKKFGLWVDVVTELGEGFYETKTFLTPEDAQLKVAQMRAYDAETAEMRECVAKHEAQGEIEL